MPQLSKYRRLRENTFQHLIKSYQKTKAYKLLSEKLKSNNKSLAKALSKEKEENQSLFTQNVALVAQIQDLGLACNKRDATISNILRNAKEVLNVLVSASGYVTDTISRCQEFAESHNGNILKPRTSAGKRESYSRRLSTKSPTRGVVKPMVSGHTITKPTINLSRLNMQHFNNPANLSIIQEVSLTETRDQELSPRSPAAVSIRQRRSESGRPRRMPERLRDVDSPRLSEENERRLTMRKRKIEKKRSRPKSSRLSGSSSFRSSLENAEHIVSARVELNDVSKLLQNSQSINIRMLNENQNEQTHDNSQSADELHQNQSNGRVMIPETPTTGGSTGDSDNTVQNMEVESENESFARNIQTIGKISKRQSYISNIEDPLEGPSWLFNNSETVPCKTSKTGENDDVNVSNNDGLCPAVSNGIALQDAMDDRENAQISSPLPKRTNHVHNSKKSKPIGDKNEHKVQYTSDTHGSNSCDEPRSSKFPKSNRTEGTVQNGDTMNLSNFVTQRRGKMIYNEEEEDFTLMYRRPQRNMHFDINDLKLPVLETSVLKPTIALEPEPEITRTIQKISQICPISSVANHTLDESVFNQSPIHLPSLENNYDHNATQDKELQLSQQKKRARNTESRNSDDSLDYTPTAIKKNSPQKKKKKKIASNKDPSTAKVVLQKLNDCDVKPRTPSPEEIFAQDCRNSSRSPVSSRHYHSSDSDCSNASGSSTHAVSRPRRKRNTVNLQEPNLKSKLRRNH